jgi:uncharacterized membrane protein YagU involved in acid resistance
LPSNDTACGSITSGAEFSYDSSIVLSGICIHPPPSSVKTSKATPPSSPAYKSAISAIHRRRKQRKNKWQWLLAAFGFAIIISFIWMFCLRCVAGVIVWCCIFGIIIFFTAIGVVFLYNNGKISTLRQYNYLDIIINFILVIKQKNYDLF